MLNEVMSRYPRAISFAPGAPHPKLVEDVDFQRYIETYVTHLTRDKGIGEEQARRMLLEYGPSRGLINDIVAQALRRDHGIDSPESALVITVGAQEAMLLVLRALFATPADTLAVANPCFVGITGAARLLNIDVVGIDETMAGLDLDALQKACAAARGSGRRIRACYVAPDFSNPSGSRMTLDCRRRLLELAEQEDLLLIEDNAYGFTAEPGNEFPPLKALDRGRRVIHVGTFAKVCFPGARVGYVVADQHLAAEGGGEKLLAAGIADIKGLCTVNTSPICQAVIGGLLLEHGGSLIALSRSKLRLYRRNLACLADALDRHLRDETPPGIRWNRPEGGFFICMDLPVPVNDALLEMCAEKYGVLWVPMSQFYIGGGGGNKLRLSCSYLDPRQIETGVERLARFLRNEIRP
ncbi:PLP-dependent aminotransferase family protein [Streptosporangium sandarakinum]|uniref:aminotransferase-like domain-containing protein n=1 Tax=Streptosporangium sandarakinum TaxID=1260955 RepID=UPI0034325F64